MQRGSRAGGPRACDVEFPASRLAALCVYSAGEIEYTPSTVKSAAWSTGQFASARHFSKALSATAAPAAERAYAWKHCGAFAPAQVGTA